MIATGIYGYIDIMSKAADASWTRNEVLANNIANNDTPGYKRKDVAFEDLLATELRATRYQNLDASVRNADLSRLNGKVYTDSTQFSYRIDGNNVDIDTENVELASNQVKYDTLINSIKLDFAQLRSVIK